MGELVDLRFGEPTSVGPVPIADAVEAVRFAFDAQPSLPTLPVLCGVDSSLLAQAVSGLADVHVDPPGLLGLEADSISSASMEAAASLRGPEFAALRAFCAQLAHHVHDHGEVFNGVRLPVLGPVTLALALRSAGLAEADATAVAAQLVAARSTAMLSAVRDVLPHHLVAVVLAEPGLIGAMHPTFPLDVATVRHLLDPVVDALDAHARAGNLLIGVHVAGRTDWETIISSGVSLISVPADDALVPLAEVVADYLERGGTIAWGAVPVDEPLGTGDELLWRRLSGLWCTLVGEGVDPMMLRRQSMIGPVDGLGHFGPSQAERALALVESLSTNVRRQALSARLSLGA